MTAAQSPERALALLESWCAMPGDTRRVFAVEFLPELGWRVTLGLGHFAVECVGRTLAAALADGAQVVAADPSLGAES